MKLNKLKQIIKEEIANLQMEKQMLSEKNIWCECHCANGGGNSYCCVDPWYPCRKKPEGKGDRTANPNGPMSAANVEAMGRRGIILIPKPQEMGVSYKRGENMVPMGPEGGGGGPGLYDISRRVRQSNTESVNGCGCNGKSLNEADDMPNECIARMGGRSYYCGKRCNDREGCGGDVFTHPLTGESGPCECTRVGGVGMVSANEPKRKR